MTGKGPLQAMEPSSAIGNGFDPQLSNGKRERHVAGMRVRPAMS